jgi:hypothetical protein
MVWVGCWYFPGFTLAALVLFCGLLAYWFTEGESKPPAQV